MATTTIKLYPTKTIIKTWDYDKETYYNIFFDDSIPVITFPFESIPAGKYHDMSTMDVLRLWKELIEENDRLQALKTAKKDVRKVDIMSLSNEELAERMFLETEENDLRMERLERSRNALLERVAKGEYTEVWKPSDKTYHKDVFHYIAGNKVSLNGILMSYTDSVFSRSIAIYRIVITSMVRHRKATNRLSDGVAQLFHDGRNDSAYDDCVNMVSMCLWESGEYFPIHRVIKDGETYLDTFQIIPGLWTTKRTYFKLFSAVDRALYLKRGTRSTKLVNNVSVDSLLEGKTVNLDVPELYRKTDALKAVYSILSDKDKKTMIGIIRYLSAGNKLSKLNSKSAKRVEYVLGKMRKCLNFTRMMQAGKTAEIIVKECRITKATYEKWNKAYHEIKLIEQYDLTI